MRSRRWTRRWLVATNLLLLSAVLPAVGHSDDGERRTKRPAAKSRPKHRPAKNVKASPSDNQGSSTGDDDDDDGNVAGDIAGACCVGFIGAMANSAANDASDVEGDYGEPRGSASEPPASWTQSDPGEALGSFDAKAAKRALGQAAQEVGEQCEDEPERLTGRKVMVSFDPSGKAMAAALDPPLEEGSLADCAQRTFLGAQVPPFAGDPAVVTMTLEGAAPAED